MQGRNLAIIVSLTAALLGCGSSGSDSMTIGGESSDPASSAESTSPLSESDGAPSDGDQSSSAVDEIMDDGPSQGSGPETFVGEIPIERPAIRELPLEAGEAARIFVVPQNRGGEDYSGDFSMAIGVDEETFWGWSSFTSQFYSDDLYGLFSDDGRFFSDFSDDYAAAATSPYLLARTAYYNPPAIEFGSYPANFYFSYGRGWGSASENGTWLQFIAPADGEYQLLISGYGAFSVTIETAKLSDEIQAELSGGGIDGEQFDQGPEIENPFPFSTNEGLFEEVVASHLDFLFDDSFFPVDEFFSDYFSDDDGLTPGQDEPYGPSGQVRDAVEEMLGL